MNYFLNNPDEVKVQVKQCEDILKEVLERKFDKYFRGFLKSYEVFLSSTPLTWEKIIPIPNDRIQIYNELSCVNDSQVTNLLSRLVVIKLNGGLGTTMGCSYPKSLITVRDGMNFLDITMAHLNHINTTYKSKVPLVLMNSYSTEAKTQATLHKYRKCVTKIHTFSQSQYPRICSDTLMPMVNEKNIDDDNCWFPPGHGNFYESFFESGLMKQFIDEGRDIAFVSNIDNLGATVDLKILNFMCQKNHSENEFLMEITDKTKSDVKGGTLIQYDGSIRLMEIAQVPYEHVGDFKLISKFTVFNTNNIWLNLRKIHSELSKNPLQMDVMPNYKLETAIGSAVKNFKGSLGIKVPRSRFLPVKNNSDLLLVMSNIYDLVDGELKMSDKRLHKTTPIIQLSGPYFKAVDEFLTRFRSIPDIIELDHLAVSGDVIFSRNLTFKGTVIILAQHGEHIDIPRGTILENKIVSGNLRIVDH
ncbi:UTP--glucose-1-phosphate uridylyltransferase [Thelohanellus kitauei]|uniref:UTP--glucose-1-phosphate uridylyltransferase n=1 Tax=Thelohanellus kitauei TaxID=669202 RepID=A0A0C2MVP9_THEKT|nr:UTP--glucose-1-phosphate uridylyltransferase [Thelohanellus kitauei]